MVQGPLRGLRVAVTIPPPAYFGGVDFAFAVDMQGELERLGASAFVVEVAPFLAGDQAQINVILMGLRTFRPDVALSLPNAGYAVCCSTPKGENIFRDILRIPTILIWDHGALQFSQLLLSPLPQCPSPNSSGCIERLRKQLDHPLYLHYSPDRGHVAAVERLGILTPGKVRSFVHFAFPAYTRDRSPAAKTGAPRVVFAGNIYLDRSRTLPYRAHPVLAEIENGMLESRKTEMTRSFWEILLAKIEHCGGASRAELGLQPDSAFFWTFMHDEIEFVGNTRARLDVLTRLDREFEFFGNFVEPQAAPSLAQEYGIRLCDSLDCVSQLPSLYANSELTIDVINAGYISGTSPKVTSCLAAGGLILFDYKDDFRAGMGEIADLVMYRTQDQLNSMVERYLGDPRLRRQIATAMRDRVLREFTFGSFCRRVLDEEAVWRA